MFDEAAIAREIVVRYTLPLRGDHGIAHWARVRDNGQRLALVTGADLDVVTLFALFHDACRENEFDDPSHGARGAALARSFQGTFLQLSSARLALLEQACREHAAGLLTDDPTLGACWDADRLDLARVGISPRSERLCTLAARDLLPWADERARSGHVPAWLEHGWGVSF